MKVPQRRVVRPAAWSILTKKGSTMVRIRQSTSGVQQGQVIGGWEVIGPPFGLGAHYWVVARCKCGRVGALRCDNILRRCPVGCDSCVTDLNVIHGHNRKGRRQALYVVWQSIKGRCQRKSHVAFKNYGARGIQVCDEWSGSYPKFMEWALANGYEAGREIDRRNNDGNYEPGNCRWVTVLTQARNRRNNRLVLAFSETKCVSEWEADSRCMVSGRALVKRLNRGWESELAITTPSRSKK